MDNLYWNGFEWVEVIPTSFEQWQPPAYVPPAVLPAQPPGYMPSAPPPVQPACPQGTGALTGIAKAKEQHEKSQAQPGCGANLPGISSPLADPRFVYPRAPFAAQDQPWPGLNSKMIPIPDCGESTYKGCCQLTGRKALVTGGDSGIGRAAAIALAREGADVAISYLPAEESDAREVKALIEAAGRKAILLPGDIRSEKWCRALVEKAYAQLGGLDIVVSNAAYQVSQKSILDISDEQFDQTMKTNIYGTFRILRAAIPKLPPGAAIIITSSVQGLDPSPNLTDYAMTKSALWNLTQSLSRQLMEKGIRVNAVAPAPVWTPLQTSGGQPTASYMEYGKTAPMGRPAQPAELASVYVFLASNAASNVTGQLYGVTSGFRLV